MRLLLDTHTFIWFVYNADQFINLFLPYPHSL